MTDRAYRYRANHPSRRPPPPVVCNLCGHDKNVDVHHIDGHEENSHPENLMWACRSCNVRIANHARKNNRGRLTRQYNGKRAAGASTLGEWVRATMAYSGVGSDMDYDSAVSIIAATPRDVRSGFAKEIWRRRREHGTEKWSTSAPF